MYFKYLGKCEAEAQRNSTHGNIYAHVSKLEAAGYIEVVKEFVDRKPHTMLRLTGAGRDAFREYRKSMMRMLLVR